MIPVSEDPASRGDMCAGACLVTNPWAAAAPASGGEEEPNLAINYLDFVVRRGKHRNPAIYNYLLSLLAEQVRKGGGRW